MFKFISLLLSFIQTFWQFWNHCSVFLDDLYISIASFVLRPGRWWQSSNYTCTHETLIYKRNRSNQSNKTKQKPNNKVVWIYGIVYSSRFAKKREIWLNNRAPFCVHWNGCSPLRQKLMIEWIIKSALESAESHVLNIAFRTKHSEKWSMPWFNKTANDLQAFDSKWQNCNRYRVYRQTECRRKKEKIK